MIHHLFIVLELIPSCAQRCLRGITFNCCIIYSYALYKISFYGSAAFWEQWRPTWSTMQLLEYGLTDAYGARVLMPNHIHLTSRRLIPESHKTTSPSIFLSNNFPRQSTYQPTKLRGRRRNIRPNLDPPPLIKSKSDLEMPKVTPVRGPWLLDNGP